MATADNPFSFPHLDGPIVSATFSGNFAEFTANPTVLGIQVNQIELVVSGFAPLDLTNSFFGNVPYPGIPAINMVPMQTGIISVPIPASFFPALENGVIGYAMLFTDTGDGVFAIDYLSIQVNTADASYQSFVGPNDEFGLGIPPNGMLPCPLPICLPFGSTGTGFDESISSKSLITVPEPAPFLLLVGGFVPFFARRLRRVRLPSHAAFVLMAITILCAPLWSKTVVCIAPDSVAGPASNTFLNNHEGYERQKAKPGDVIVKGGAIRDCLANLVNGDTLVLIAHGNPGQFGWGDGTDYFGFGSGADDAPVPPNFNQLMNITFTFCSCFSSVAPANGSSMVTLLTNALGHGATGAGFSNFALSNNRYCLKGGTQKQNDAAAACLDASNWSNNNPPANRPGTGGNNQPGNQKTAAQAVVDACPGAGGAGVVTVTQIKYSIPQNVVNNPGAGGGNILLCDGQTCEFTGGGLTGLLGMPNQLHLYGPVPNQIPVGESAAILGTVESVDSSVTGYPGAQVTYTDQTGNVTFTSGSISPNGTQSTVTTDINGMAPVTFIPNHPGNILIHVTVGGSRLSAFSFSTAF